MMGNDTYTKNAKHTISIEYIICISSYNHL